jgi:hypothetical protein
MLVPAASDKEQHAGFLSRVLSLPINKREVTTGAPRVACFGFRVTRDLLYGPCCVLQRGKWRRSTSTSEHLFPCSNAPVANKSKDTGRCYFLVQG